MFQIKIAVEISFFEIYNEKIHDLLASCKDKGGKKTTVCSTKCFHSFNFICLHVSTFI